MDSGKRRTTSDALVEDATDVTVAPAPRGGYQTSKHDALIDPPMDSTGREELPSGTLLGEYKIEQKIGEGGMGAVYAAVHPRIGKRAAIKVLRRELCQDASQVRRFVDEARVVNEIGHPNIVDVFAFGDMPDGRCYFVMEWLKGESLRARLDAGPPPLGEIGAIVRPLARALEAAHEKGIIHRDLKPDNIFLVDVRGAEATVKLLDFGIAKLVRADKRMDKTATGTMIGTPQYIAPEQARGYSIDHAVDIYSLGGIVFEMLTGRPPFIADNAMDMVAKHLLETPPSVASLRPDVPRELDALVAGMLAKEATSRPSMAAVLEAFDAASSTRLFDARGSTPSGVAWAATSAPVMSTLMVTPSAPVRVGTNAGPATTEPVSVASAVGAVPPVSMSVDVAAPEPRAGRNPLLFVALAGGAVLAAVVAFVIVRSTSGGDETPDKPPPAEVAPATTPTPRQDVAPTTPPPVAPAQPIKPVQPAQPQQPATAPPSSHVVSHPPPHTVGKPKATPPPKKPPPNDERFVIPTDDNATMKKTPP